MNRSDEKEARLIVRSGGARASEQILLNSALDAERAVSAEEYREALTQERSTAGGGLSVYVHLPFCPSRCLTCDHHTNVVHDSRQVDRYLDAIERELELVTEHLGRGVTLQQLHLGGGTPNYLSEVQLARLIDILDSRFTFTDQTVTSLDANAHRASFSQLMLLHGLGFRSLNLEIRDLDPHVQEALGRHQSLEVVRDVIESARKVGFTSISTDLVYGLPRQNLSRIRGTIKSLLNLAPDRVHCFPYSRRVAGFPHQRAISNRELPSLGDKVAMFSRIVDGFCEAGYEWIGLDCFALSSDSIAVAHRDGSLRRNWIGYTTLPGRSVLGLGSSAVSDLSTITMRNQPTLEEWQRDVENGSLPVATGQLLSPKARARRHALSDLMCNLSLDDTEQSLRIDGEEDPALQALRDEGLLEIHGDRLSVTESGRFALHQSWGDSSPSYRWGGTSGI